jgi:hypothetical protein
MQDLHAVTLGTTWLVVSMQLRRGYGQEMHPLHRVDPLACAAGQDMQPPHGVRASPRRSGRIASETGL